MLNIATGASEQHWEGSDLCVYSMVNGQSDFLM